MIDPLQKLLNGIQVWGDKSDTWVSALEVKNLGDLRVGPGVERAGAEFRGAIPCHPEDGRLTSRRVTRSP